MFTPCRTGRACEVFEAETCRNVLLFLNHGTDVAKGNLPSLLLSKDPIWFVSLSTLPPCMMFGFVMLLFFNAATEKYELLVESECPNKPSPPRGFGSA
jgi:hypothetical protein